MLRTLYVAAPFETPFSLLIALAATTTDPKVRQLRTRLLLGGAPLLQTAPCRLELFCNITNECYGDPARVLAERTLFPFYAGCLNPASAAKLATQVCRGKESQLCCPAPPVHLRAGNRYGMNCPECSKRNLELTGRRCSLTLHCLPFLTRCPVHQCQLEVVANCGMTELMFLTTPDRGRRRNSLGLGEMCSRFLQDTVGQHALVAATKTLQERGYVSENGKLRMAHLIRDCAAALSAGFEDTRLDIWLSSGNLLPRLLHDLGSPKNLPHPTAVALLQIALSRIEYSTPLTLPSAAKRDSKAPAACQRWQRIQENRDLWTAHQTKQAGRSRKAIRSTAAALWMWLYRNDRQWLNCNQARSTRSTSPQPRPCRDPTDPTDA